MSLPSGYKLLAIPKDFGLSNGDSIVTFDNSVSGQNDGSQATSGNRAVIAGGETPASVQVASFDGSNDEYSFGNIMSGWTSGSIFIIVKTGTDGNSALWVTGGSSGYYATGGGSNLFESWGQSSRDNYTTGDLKQWRMHSVIVKSDGTWKVFQDGTEKLSYTRTIAFPSDFILGRNGDPIYLNGKVAAILAYDRDLNSSEQAQVKDHFANLFQLTSLGYVPPDTTRPSDVTNLTATKVSNSRVDIDSDAASDNVAVAGYITQRRIDGGSWVTLTPTTKAFQDTEDFPTDDGTYTFEYRRIAYDTAGTSNESLNWSNIPSVEITIIVPVEITSASPIEGTVGQSVSGSFTKTGGSGSGTWSKIAGDFPTGVSMNSVGARSGNLTELGEFEFTLRFVDAENPTNIDEKDFVWIVEEIQLESSYSPNTSLEAPVEITFTEETAGTVTDQRIKFGDYVEKIQADDADFVHTYLAPGTYQFERWAKINGVPAYETYDIVIGGNPPDPPTATAIEFDEIELNRYYSEGAIGGPEYSTNILGNPLGAQQRNANRAMGIHSYELNFEGLRFDDDAEEKFDEFLDFFHTRQGALIGFRFFPFVDNCWRDEEIAKTNTSTAIYNLIRTYKKAGRTRIRRICKPVPDLMVTINDDPATDYSLYTIDYTEGRIIFDDESSLPNNGSLKVTGYYCIPVVFAADKLPTSGFATYVDLMGLRVVELPLKALGITD